MIRRLRLPDSCPESLKPTNKKGAGSKEKKKTLAWLDSLLVPPPLNRPDFKAYKGKDVVEALAELFKNKCAYCESRYATTQPVDVEHWRPKARIDGLTDHTGYGWLAMDWENLLPSCIDCNRARSQTVPDSSSPTQWIVQTVGKADQFPIVDPTKRWTYKNDQHPEGHLLIDPCFDDPAEYFDFEENGILLPKRGLEPGKLNRALASILVYALNRKGLVDERLRHILRLDPIFELVRFLYKASANEALPQDFRETATILVSQTLDSLHESCADDMPYSQFLKRRVERFLREELGAS